ncbi:hypothetical protein QFC19_008294 [Naganishia cerealis]|uniref:Uncharacterized protein n=1 Tax=Naganishia cerealis TaxID=610337 RepID=A0ACC2V3H5_9TREE|nr:hypothetical protein QFC19_008294 [Naganishia cerealis]
MTQFSSQFPESFEQQPVISPSRRDEGWGPQASQSVDSSISRSPDTDEAYKGRQAASSWDREQRSKDASWMADQSRNSDMRTKLDSWNLSTLETHSAQGISVAARMSESILVDVDEIVASPSDMTNLPFGSGSTSWETAVDHESLIRSVYWELPHNLLQSDTVSGDLPSPVTKPPINHSTYNQQVNAHTTCSTTTPAASFQPRSNSKNQEEDSVTVDAKVSSAKKEEKRATDLDELALRTAQTQITPPLVRGIWDSLPIQNTFDYSGISSVPVASGTMAIVYESSPSSASATHKKPILTSSVPPDRKLSASIHAASAKKARCQSEMKHNHYSETVGMGKARNGRNERASHPAGSITRKLGSKTPAKGISWGSTGPSQASEGWVVKPDTRTGDRTDEKVGVACQIARIP